MNFCLCGCGTQIKENIHFVCGHNRRGKQGWNKGLTKENSPKIFNISKNISKSRKGQKPTEEHRLKNSKSHKGLKQNSETIEKRVAKIRGRKNNKLSFANFKRFDINTELGRQRRHFAAARASERMKDENFKNKFLDAANSSEVIKRKLKRQGCPNRQEVRFLIWLNDNLNGEWGFTGDGTFKIERKSPDYKHEYLPILIEYYGTKWHTKQEEKERIEFFRERGWHCFVVWDYQFKNDSDNLLSNIIDFTYQIKSII